MSTLVSPVLASTRQMSSRFRSRLWRIRMNDVRAGERPRATAIGVRQLRAVASLLLGGPPRRDRLALVLERVGLDLERSTCVATSKTSTSSIGDVLAGHRIPVGLELRPGLGQRVDDPQVLHLARVRPLDRELPRVLAPRSGRTAPRAARTCPSLSLTSFFCSAFFCLGLLLVACLVARLLVLLLFLLLLLAQPVLLVLGQVPAVRRSTPRRPRSAASPRCEGSRGSLMAFCRFAMSIM